MSYDDWKTTDPTELGPDRELEHCDRCGASFVVDADHPRPSLILCDACHADAMGRAARRGADLSDYLLTLMADGAGRVRHCACGKELLWEDGSVCAACLWGTEAV